MITGPGRRPSHQPLLEVLEDRQLLTSASLQPISSLTVPARQGFTVPLLANSGATDAQTYTVTSSNPDIAASIATGPFWTVGVSYTDPNNASNDFSGKLTSQLFQSLTPITVGNISMLTNDGYFVNSGKFFSRIISGFVVQGGSPTLDGSEPNPPVSFGTEILQQLAFTGTFQLGMAHSSLPNSDTSQFFITLGPQSTLDYAYTVFGQLLTGIDTVNKMAAVPVMTNQSTQEKSQPVNPITLTSAALSSTNPNGVLILDTTQARQTETSTITVTATDTANNTKTTQKFDVTVGAYGGPTSPAINFRPLADSFLPSVTPNTATPIQLRGKSGYPNTATPGTLTYALLSQPTHGTVSKFNAATGTLTYTPASGFIGTDTLTYQVTATGPKTAPATTTSNVATVTFLVGAQNTMTATQVDNALVVTPVPRRDHGNNTIVVSQVPESSSTTASSLLVTVNGIVDQQSFPTSVSRIFVFGGRKANNDITIDPSVTAVPATISSGQGIRNRLKGGSTPTREHGWYGHTTLIGGAGPNQLIGLAGHVKFKPTKTTTLIFAGQPGHRTHNLNPVPPIGTFYRFVHGHLVPIPASVFKAPHSLTRNHRLEN
jgi:cyclophilin family peptidyl-prolyl cis-trans isomerase